MKESSALSGGLISHYPEPVHACAFVLPLTPQVQKGSIPEIFRIKKGLIFSPLPSQAFRPGGKEGGMQGVNNNKQEGKRCLALGEFRLGQFDLSQSTLGA